MAMSLFGEVGVLMQSTELFPPTPRSPAGEHETRFARVEQLHRFGALLLPGMEKHVLTDVNQYHAVFENLSGHGIPQFQSHWITAVVANNPRGRGRQIFLCRC